MGNWQEKVWQMTNTCWAGIQCECSHLCPANIYLCKDINNTRRARFMLLKGHGSSQGHMRMTFVYLSPISRLFVCVHCAYVRLRDSFTVHRQRRAGHGQRENVSHSTERRKKMKKEGGTEKRHNQKENKRKGWLRKMQIEGGEKEKRTTDGRFLSFFKFKTAHSGTFDCCMPPPRLWDAACAPALRRTPQYLSHKFTLEVAASCRGSGSTQCVYLGTQ